MLRPEAPFPPGDDAEVRLVTSGTRHNEWVKCSVSGYDEQKATYSVVVPQSGAEASQARVAGPAGAEYGRETHIGGWGGPHWPRDFGGPVGIGLCAGALMGARRLSGNLSLSLP